MLNMKRIVPQRGNDAAHRLKVAYHGSGIHCFPFVLNVFYRKFFDSSTPTLVVEIVAHHISIIVHFDALSLVARREKIRDAIGRIGQSLVEQLSTDHSNTNQRLGRIAVRTIQELNQLVSGVQRNHSYGSLLCWVYYTYRIFSRQHLRKKIFDFLYKQISCQIKILAVSTDMLYT